MYSNDSISQWIDKVRQGDEAAAQTIWDRYFPDLVRIARQKLQATSRRAADEEDVALSALGSFFRAAQKNRFPDLRDRDGLWRLLSEMTRRKAITLIRRNRAQKAGGGRVRGESAFGIDGDSANPGIGNVAGDGVTPELAALLEESTRALLEELEDEELKSIALAKMEGNQNDEIAKQLNCSVATVERRLRLIRTVWTKGTPSCPTKRNI